MNSNYIPLYSIMINMIEALLRLREHQKNNRSLAPYVPVLSYQIDRNWDGSWVAARELKYLADMDYVMVNPDTGEVRPTVDFDTLANIVFDDTQLPQHLIPDTQTGYNMDQMIDTNAEETLGLLEYEHKYFDMDELGGIQLRSRVIEYDPGEDWRD